MPALGQKMNAEYQQAAALLTKGKTKEAVTILREIVSKNPAHTNAMVSLAVALMQAEDAAKKDSPSAKEALDLLDKATTIAPKDPVPLFNKGVCLRSLGMLEESLGAFEAALKREKKQPLAILHMAEINYELERWDKALELARLALIRDPGLKDSLGWVPDAVRKAAEQKGEPT
jgi:tetratricopeptide (TPR) repeat protein